MDFSVTEIAPVKMITRIDAEDSFPKMPEGQIAIFIGAYSKMSKDLINQIDSFALSMTLLFFVITQVNTMVNTECYQRYMEHKNYTIANCYNLIY